ncbi:hypothetical protein SAV14893_078110 [Streptomyces avermitilis]|uniref:DhaL domain-containing protein n=1 Tax=Streptomyces avermitilis TaxID=33903 RepID=A0A4D4M9A0_STRAX|nr:DAK2 domain-containing protein [Streptomyces avermitilis]GDY68418.1 hypothetical protein SAV14893_078110 [Streptomyces avermitilis]
MSSPSTPAGDLAFVVRTMARTAVDNEKAFGDLDAVAGDGDFGYSLARGFEIVLADWDTLAADSPAEFLKKVALVISRRVGGTSGPLWGTAFLRASGAVKDRPELAAADAVAMLRAAAEGIKTRGKSDVGDKTLLDALIPMTDALEQRLAEDGPGPARRNSPGWPPRRPGPRPTRRPPCRPDAAARATPVSAVSARRTRARWRSRSWRSASPPSGTHTTDGGQRAWLPGRLRGPGTGTTKE